MKKIDIIFSLGIGEAVALFFYFILVNAGVKIAPLLPALAILLPLLALFGLFIAYLIGKKFLFVFQLAKFLLVGGLATVADIGVLNILMEKYGIDKGLYYVVFKGFSFIVATCFKYFVDKYWAFEQTEKKGMGKEFGQFFLVTIVGFVINVVIASVVVNMIGPKFGITEKLWGTIGALAATVVVFTWNFIGYKFIVFKK